MPGPLHLAFLGCGFITRVHSRQLRAFGGPYDMVRDHVLCMRSVAVGESIVIPVHQAAGLTRSLDVVAFERLFVPRHAGTPGPSSAPRGVPQRDALPPADVAPPWWPDVTALSATRHSGLRV